MRRQEGSTTPVIQPLKDRTGYNTRLLDSDINLKIPLTNSSARNDIVEAFFASSSLSHNDDIATAHLVQEVKSISQDMEPFLIATRRTLHKYPELMYQEQVTSQIIQRILTDLNVPYSTGWAKNIHPNVYAGAGGHGIVAELGTGKPPCVLLRADMDGLPVSEETKHAESTVESSYNVGQMHACGHDAHMAILIGATAVLKQMERSINGTVRIMFQPAEEGGAGAKRMVEEGVLSKYPPVQHAFGLHVRPTLASGKIGGRPGCVLAAAEHFTIELTGVGGHAAMPHLAIDPVVTASAIVMGVQTLVSRRLSPLESGVISITQIDSGGNAMNVIPASVKLGGTIRALSTEALVALREQFMQFVRQMAHTYGCNVTKLSYMTDYYPPTVNDINLWGFASEVASSVAVDGKVVEVVPTMGGEDFAFVADKVPSAFFFLGQGGGVDPPTNFGLHHSQFSVDDNVLVRGVQLHVNLALRTIKRL